MDKIKKPKLDICNYDNKCAHTNSGKRPSETIGRGSKISVQQNGYEISLTILIKEEDYFIGKIIALYAPRDEYEYKGLEVGDHIKFKKENICSIP